MKTLYLTPTETSVFATLPEAVRDGWELEKEVLTYADTSEKQVLRLSLIRLHDPSLIHLRDKALEAATIEEVTALIHSMDVRLVDEDDLAELCFAIGPSMLSRLIVSLMKMVTNDKEMEAVTALTLIRHAILRSLQPVS